MQHKCQLYNENGFEIVELSNEQIKAKVVVNIGNSLFSLTSYSEEKLFFPFTLEAYSKNSKLAGNPFMHPWANRLEGDYITIEGDLLSFPEENKHLLYRDGNNLPLHGLLLKSKLWKTIECKDEDDSCFHLAEFQFDEQEYLSIFPYRHTIQIKHVLQQNKLTIETILINLDEKPMPVSFGFHPYFLRTQQQSTLTIPAKHTLATTDKMIPTGKSIAKEDIWSFSADNINLDTILFDNGFVDLVSNEKGIAVFEFNDSKVEFGIGYNCAQIYSPAFPEKPYVCIEPMTAITNALNTNDCEKIQPGETFTAAFAIVL